MTELPIESFDVVVVGGGPAGLAVSQQLCVRNISNVVLEKGDRPGWMWAHVYDSLRLHTGRHLSSLPGMPFPSETPLFPDRRDLTSYLEDYENRFQLPVRTAVEATALERESGSWLIETGSSRFRARAVVVATGIMSSPVLPDLKGLSTFRGLILHTSEYRRPEEHLGHSILVVGIGNSAAEISSELANSGREITLSVRSGANVIPRTIAGIPSQYIGWAMSWLPEQMQRRIVRGTGALGALLRRESHGLPRKPDIGHCGDVPVIGRSILDHIRARLVRVVPGVESFSENGARFIDGSEWSGDTVLLATGYRAAIQWMGHFVNRDECGFAQRRDRVTSAAFPDLYFVGHNYDGRGGLFNIRIDARKVARLIARSHSQW